MGGVACSALVSELLKMKKSIAIHYWQDVPYDAEFNNNVININKLCGVSTGFVILYIYIYIYIYIYFTRMVKKDLRVSKVDHTIWSFLIIFLFDNFIYIINIYTYTCSNSIYFITKVLNIIHKQWNHLYQNDKEIKPRYQVRRVSCKHALQSSVCT